MRPILILLTLGLCESLIIHENVIFQKVNEITLTRSKWLVTFVLDLKPYSNFLQKLSSDIAEANQLSTRLLRKYEQPERNRFRDTFLSLKREVFRLKRAKDMSYLPLWTSAVSDKDDLRSLLLERRYHSYLAQFQTPT